MHVDPRDGLIVYRFESIPANRVDAFVSTRVGGVSTAPYASLNVGLRVGDEDAAVVENRRRLFAAYDLPLERSVWCKQVHGNSVAVVTDREIAPRNDGARDRGAFSEATIIQDCDALITQLVGVPLCITLADCVPVVLYDNNPHAVGLVHAGWRGTVHGIVGQTVHAMREHFGTDPASLVAAIGPSISPERYEVGADVIALAREAYGDAAVLHPVTSDKALFDLWEASALDLERSGVSRDRIEIAAISTIDALDRFYSHRAERTTGRVAAAVMLR